jgi:hypothetical protein
VAARDDDRDPVRDCGLVEREDARIVVVERRVAPAREQRDPPASELLDRAADLVDAVGVVRVDAREPDEPARVRVDELRDVGVLDATPDRGRLLITATSTPSSSISPTNSSADLASNEGLLTRPSSYCVTVSGSGALGRGR